MVVSWMSMGCFCLIDYLFTPEGQQIAAAKGFIPVK